MCTLSFIPAQEKIFLVHSRDEKITRSPALPPAVYTVNGYPLLFPKDTGGGGAWIACNRQGSAAALLNGACKKHVRKPPYRKSRGLVFLDIMASGNPFEAWEQADLQDIEPFTLIIWHLGLLQEYLWNGQEQQIIRLPASTPRTWSSVTLYSQAAVAAREQWFIQWLQQHPHPSLQDLIQYHLQAGAEDQHNALRMHRGHTQTLSLTAIATGYETTCMQYLDLGQQHPVAAKDVFFTKAAGAVS